MSFIDDPQKDDFTDGWPLKVKMTLITILRSKRQQELQKKLELTATTTTQAQKQEMIAGSLKMSPRNSSNQSNVRLGCLGKLS